MWCPTLIRWTFVSVILLQFAHAQITINGQLFTNGLSIVDSPAPNTPFSTGGTLPIAIEVSGNGKLPSDAQVPGSSASTRYDLLEIFLVSSETLVNITVSSGPGLLTEETGTVRHLNWAVPTCVPSGNYNLTFYESSHINDQAHFAITPITIKITNNDGAQSPCSTGSNGLQNQPQASSPVPLSPFLPGSAVTTLVYVSTVTQVTTKLGQPVSTTFTATYTTTMAAGQDTSGFLPVNASPRNEARALSIVVLTILALSVLNLS
ncbi:hypothetical protein DXG01_000100 [Tephrocybe rancida]|nr:hypothetical protein DXG01_000100 [Tephrocybe rancida]